MVAVGPARRAQAEAPRVGTGVSHILARRDKDMAEAVDARKLVGQAMGNLMERFDLDADRAFTVLRRYSQDSNVKLRDVAQQLIDTCKLPGPPATPR